jgi:Ca2+-binding RTX toxin-like protein
MLGRWSATRRFAVVLLFATLLPASSAHAALSLSGASVSPSTRQAGAHQNFTLTFNVSGGDHIRNLVTELPPGLTGNPTKAALCTTFPSCPPESQIGDGSSVVDVTFEVLPGVPVTQEVEAAGGVYNLVPQGSDPATLGIVLNAQTPLPPPIINSSPVTLIGHASARTSDFGLNTTILDIPRSTQLDVGGLVPLDADVVIKSTTLTLYGANPQFMTNPTSCGTKTTRIIGTSYEGNSAQTTADFTSVGCENQTYKPNLGVTLDFSKGKDYVDHPDLTTSVTQGLDEANSKRVEAIMPNTLQANNAALIDQCDLANFYTSTCPAKTQVGTAVAATPLLFQALSGPVYLTKTPTLGGLPQIGLDLKGPLPAQIIGNVTPTSDFRLDNVFGDVPPGLPDVPLTLFKLTFNGGKDGLITATEAVCEKGVNTYDAVFDSWGGQHVTQTGNATLKGCGFVKRLSKNRCNGKKLTDVGSKRANVIRGTRKRDVINGLGGKDKIVGLKGNDLLCGGKGKDKISGGAGKDKMFGGKGKDQLFGGGGRDKLAGGPGKDRQVQ